MRSRYFARLGWAAQVCRVLNQEALRFCEILEADNVGIYVWGLRTDEEHLVTTGGVAPYWIDRGSAPSGTPPSP
jgi:hypothetical protein